LVMERDVIGVADQHMQGMLWIYVRSIRQG